MRRLVVGSILAVLLGVAAGGAVAGAQEEDPAVRALLFFSPTCPHCEQVINVDLPPLFVANGGPGSLVFDEAGDPADRSFYLITNGTLEVMLIDVTVAAGNAMYQATSEQFRVPEARQGVPRLVVADTYLVGSAEIPELFPGIIEEGLASGGVDWPDVAGMEDALAAIPTPDPPDDGSTTTTTATTTAPGGGGVLPTTDRSWTDRFADDPLGNSLAVTVLALMVASVAGVLVLARSRLEWSRFDWVVPVLAVVGLGVAIYLAYVESSGSDAVCGPVGDCNAVQQSEYARLFGVPIGVIGIVGYVLMLGSWLVSRFASGRVSDWSRFGLFALALGGTGFSIYLTFLEPFVIGATCIWCLTSAVVVTALLWMAARPGWVSMQRLRGAA